MGETETLESKEAFLSENLVGHEVNMVKAARGVDGSEMIVLITDDRSVRIKIEPGSMQTTFSVDRVG